MVKIYSLSALALLLIGASKIHTCGVSYPLPSGTAHPNAVAFSPDGSLLVTANGDIGGPSTLALFNVDNQALINGTTYSFTAGFFASSISFLPSGGYCAVANSASNAVSIFSVTAGGLTEIASYALPAGSTNPCSLAFSPNNSYLVTANHDSSDVTLFNVSNGVLSNGISYPLPKGSSAPSSIVFSPNGSLVAVAADSKVALFTVSSGKLTKATAYSLSSGSSGACSVAFSPGGDMLATANWRSNDVTIFSVEWGGSLYSPYSYELPAGSVGPKVVVFSSDRYHLATANNASSDVTLFSVNAASSTLILGDSYALPDGSSSPNSLAFAPNGAYFAVANDGALSINDSVTLLDTYETCTMKSTTCHVGCILGLVAGGIAIVSGGLLAAVFIMPRCYVAIKNCIRPQDYTPIGD